MILVDRERTGRHEIFVQCCGGRGRKKLCQKIQDNIAYFEFMRHFCQNPSVLSMMSMMQLPISTSDSPRGDDYVIADHALLSQISKDKQHKANFFDTCSYLAYCLCQKSQDEVEKPFSRRTRPGQVVCFHSCRFQPLGYQPPVLKSQHLPFQKL
jgi:hypothetical protein